MTSYDGERAPRPGVKVRPALGGTRAVALLLAGGRENSFDPTRARHLAGLRMRPVATALRRTSARDGLAVWSVRYRYRGWNGAEMSPVEDARWALEEVRRRHGEDIRVVVVGHSMGGRTGMRIGGDDNVVGVAALAPWLPEGEPVDHLAGQRLLIAHGDLDKVTSPRLSREFADRARAVGADVDYVTVPGETHAMLRRWRTWHRLTTSFVVTALAPSR